MGGVEEDNNRRGTKREKEEEDRRDKKGGSSGGGRMAERMQNTAAITDVALEAETAVRTDAAEEEKQEERTPSETEGVTTQPSLSEVKDSWKRRGAAVCKRRPGKMKSQRSEASANDDDNESVEEPPEDTCDRDLTHIKGGVATTRVGSGGIRSSRPGAFAVTETTSSQRNNVASSTCASAVSPDQRGHDREGVTTQPCLLEVKDSWEIRSSTAGKRRPDRPGKMKSQRSEASADDDDDESVEEPPEDTCDRDLTHIKGGVAITRGGSGGIIGCSSRLSHKSSSAASDRSAAASGTVPCILTNAAVTTKAGANTLSANAGIPETDAISEMAPADQVPHGTTETEAGASADAESDNPSTNDGSSAPRRPGAYAVEGIEPSHGRRGGPQSQRPSLEGPVDVDVEQGQGQQEIMVEATLVVPDEEEAFKVDEPTSEGNAIVRASSIVVVAEQLKCGINFQDRRVRMSLCLVGVAFVALAVGLGVVLGKDGNPTTMAETEDSEDISDDIGTAPLSIDASAHPSAGPTSSAAPTGAPSPAPTSLSWEPLGSPMDGMGMGGGFGSVLSFSRDGSLLAVSFRSSQQFTSLRAVSLSATAAKLYKADEDGRWTEVTVIVPQCIYWGSTSVALSGNGRITAIASQGCGGISVEIFEPISIILDFPMDIQGANSSGAEPDSSRQEWVSTMEFVMIDDDVSPSFSPLSVLLSDEGDIVALEHGGRVEVYQLDSGFLPLGLSVDSTGAMSISADGSTLATAAHGREIDNGYVAVVKVYQYNSGNWTQVGSDIGKSAAVWATSLSADGSIVAVGGSDWPEFPLALPCSRCGPDVGQVRIYRLVDGAWALMGDPIKGDSDDDFFGTSVSLSEDGTTVAVGASGNDAGGMGSGLTRVFRHDGVGSDGGWSRVGPGILGSESGEGSGAAVALAGDGRLVAIGAPKNRAGGNDAGRVRVFQLQIE